MKFRLKEVRCNCNEECDCVPEVVLLKDGMPGYGRAVWVLDPKDNKEYYAVEMLGWKFTATCKHDIADTLHIRIGHVNDNPPPIEIY